MGVAAGDVDGDGLADLRDELRPRGEHALPLRARATACRLRRRHRGGRASSNPTPLLGWGASLFDFDCDGARRDVRQRTSLSPASGARADDGLRTAALALPQRRHGRFREISGVGGQALARAACTAGS
jgi:hypothetical protein